MSIIGTDRTEENIFVVTCRSSFILSESITLNSSFCMWCDVRFLN